jgi:ubiquitin carboxyl-terminal hydrolase L3
VVAQGQSAVVEDTWNHFVAFIEKDGCLYELDGRKEFPINHGATSSETLLEDSAKVVRGYMDRDPEELRFTMLALAPANSDEEE